MTSARRGLPSATAWTGFLVVCLGASASAHPVPRRPDLEALVDDYARGRLGTDIPGLVFVFVANDTVILAKGYGVADLSSGRPVDPDETVFRVASISKVFTDTAVMQLVERGEMALGAPIDAYIDIPIPDAFDRLITIADLLTHTSGFDQKIVDIGARTRDQVSFHRWVKTRIPHRSLPPGDLFSYSNYDVSLLGLAIEQVTKSTFTDAIDARILAPLGMTSSSFALPPPLAARLASGYVVDGADVERSPGWQCNMLPSSTLVSTATDMARFIRMHLGGGSLDDAVLLQPETIERMHSQLFTQHPRLPGNAHGFWERYHNGLRTLEHGGEWRGYGANLVLIPRENAGFFFAYTGANELVRSELTCAILDRFYPAPSPPPPVASVLNGAEVERFAGRYQSNQYARATFEKVALIVRDTEVRITASDDGSLTLHYPGEIVPPTRWLAVGPLLFRRDNSRDLIAFRQDSDATITHVFLHYFDIAVAMERIHWFGSRSVQIPLALLSLLLLLSPLLVVPLTRHYRRGRRSDRLTRNAERAALAVAAAYFSFVIGMVIVLWPTFVEPLFGIPPGFAFVLSLPLLALVADAFLGGFVLWLWRGHRGSIAQRLYLTTVVLAAIALSAALDHVNLLGPHL